MNYIGKNIGQGAFAIKKILEEFGKVSRKIAGIQEKVEGIAVKNKDRISCGEDIGKVEDSELEKIMEMDIIDDVVRRSG